MLFSWFGPSGQQEYWMRWAVTDHLTVVWHTYSTWLGQLFDLHLTPALQSWMFGWSEYSTVRKVDKSVKLSEISIQHLAGVTLSSILLAIFPLFLCCSSARSCMDMSHYATGISSLKKTRATFSKVGILGIWYHNTSQTVHRGMVNLKSH